MKFKKWSLTSSFQKLVTVAATAATMSGAAYAGNTLGPADAGAEIDLRQFTDQRPQWADDPGYVDQKIDVDARYGSKLTVLMVGRDIDKLRCKHASRGTAKDGVAQCQQKTEVAYLQDKAKIEKDYKRADDALNKSYAAKYKDQPVEEPGPEQRYPWTSDPSYIDQKIDAMMAHDSRFYALKGERTDAKLKCEREMASSGGQLMRHGMSSVAQCQEMAEKAYAHAREQIDVTYRQTVDSLNQAYARTYKGPR